MSFDNFYILLRMTRDTPLFDEVVRIMEKHVWLPAGPFPNQRHARLEGSAWFTFLYANGTGKRDPETIHRTLVFFSDYPMYIEKERHVDNHGREGVIPDPLHPEWALDPLPPKWRHSSNFIWQRCPYTIEGGDDLPRENSGNAYITPYWLGRYAGIIGEQW